VTQFEPLILPLCSPFLNPVNERVVKLARSLAINRSVLLANSNLTTPTCSIRYANKCLVQVKLFNMIFQYVASMDRTRFPCSSEGRLKWVKFYPLYKQKFSSIVEVNYILLKCRSVALEPLSYPAGIQRRRTHKNPGNGFWRSGLNCDSLL